jgi:hypothetical protein
MKVARAKHGAAAHDGRIYVVGGRSGHRPSELLDTAEVYQPGQEWTAVPGAMAAIKGPVRVTVVEKPVILPSFLGGGNA